MLRITELLRQNSSAQGRLLNAHSKKLNEQYIANTIKNYKDNMPAQKQLDRLMAKYLGKNNPYNDFEKFYKNCFLASTEFNSKFKSTLFDFKTYGNQSGYFLIRSLPQDKELMNTPNDLSSVLLQKKSFISEFWLITIGAFLGEPFSYAQENNGNLFHNVRPAQEKSQVLSSESSGILLDLHTETAFHPYCPDFLLLFCLRNDRDKQAATIVSSIRDIHFDLTDTDIHLLRQPAFRTGIDFSFGSMNGTKGNGPIMPILSGDKNDLQMTFDPDLMIGLNHQASKVLSKLKHLLDQKKQFILLEPGDLIVVDNSRAVHGRNSFKAYYDGKDRWLQRIYVGRNLHAANKLFNKRERIITHQIESDNSVSKYFPYPLTNNGVFKRATTSSMLQAVKNDLSTTSASFASNFANGR
jgi:L-asparagine oxygenase